MGAISVGSAATSRSSNQSIAGFTFIDINVPSDGTGKITSVDIYPATSDVVNPLIAIFYNVGGNNYSTRSYTQITGTFAVGGVRTIAVSLNVVIGDFIGIVQSGGSGRLSSDGAANSVYYPGIGIPAVNLGFTPIIKTLSLHGTGVTLAKSSLVPRLIAMGQL